MMTRNRSPLESRFTVWCTPVSKVLGPAPACGFGPAIEAGIASAAAKHSAALAAPTTLRRNVERRCIGTIRTALPPGCPRVNVHPMALFHASRAECLPARPPGSARHRALAAPGVALENQGLAGDGRHHRGLERLGYPECPLRPPPRHTPPRNPPPQN